MRRSKRINKVVDEDEDDDLWDFKSLKRTKKSGVKTNDGTNAKSALPKIKPCRTVSKVATQRMRSQLDSSDTEDSDCLIVATEDVDVDFKENRKRAFLSSNGISNDLISKSTSSKQTQLLVSKDELSQKLQTVKSPPPQNSGSKKTKNKQSSREKRKQDPTPNKSKDVQKTKRKSKKDEKGPSKVSGKAKETIKGKCPFCQVPFSALLRLTPDGHTMECMDLPFLHDAVECPDGLSCSSFLPSHYRKYRHTVLAESQAARKDAQNDDHVDTDVPNVDESVFTSGEKSTTLSDDRSVDVTLKLGLAKDDVCIKISCTPKSTVASTLTVSSPKQTSTSSKTDSTETSPADQEIVNLEDDENVDDIVPETRKNKKRSRKNIADEFIPEKSAKVGESGPSEMDIDLDEIEGGGFCVSDDIDDNLADKDLAELLTGSEEEQDGGGDEDEIDDTGIEIDNSCSSNRDKDTRCHNDKIDEANNEIDNTCDTGYDDVRSEINEDGNEIDEDGNEIENDFGDARNDYDQEICDTNKLTVANVEQQNVDLCESNSELSQEEKAIPSLARKQTSIFSFFNCPKATSAKKTVKQTNKANTCCDINHLKKGLSKIASTPALSGSKTVASVPLKRSSSDLTPIRPSHTDSDYDAHKGKRRMCPFYKKIPDTAMTVDAFRYGVIPGCRAYILTHFHYDHYAGLNKNFKQPIYCSKVTGNLVQSKIKVDPRYIHTLPLDQPCEVEGVELTLMEANHCPGAVIIVFRLKSGQTFLHTGDFRADPAMEQYPALVGAKIHQLYLDTTYCDPAYSFPSQNEVIKFAVSLAGKHMEACPTSLIVCGSYTIGKERVFIAIAEALKSKICVKRDKKQILDCLEDSRLNDMVTLSPDEAQVHVLPMGKLNPKNLGDHLSQHSHFTSILALEPTGWSHSNRVVSLDQIRPKYSRNGITIYGIPYSEHSSYLEMKRFTQFIKPDRILPTVNNGNPHSRKKMEDIFRKWMSEIKVQKPTSKEAIPNNKQSSLKSWFG